MVYRPIAFGIAAALFLPFAANAGDQLKGACAGVTGEVLDTGFAQGELKNVVTDQSAGASGVVWEMKNIRVVEKTNRIPLVGGSIMLVNYRLSGLPTSQPIKTLTEFPPMTGNDGRMTTKVEGTLNLPDTSSSYTGQAYWTFDDGYAFEMVAGLWTYSFFHQDCRLFRKEFQTFKPQFQQYVKWCETEGDVAPQVRASSCTALIQTGNYSGKPLARYFHIRGAAFGRIGQYPRAIEDLTQAIRLNPSLVDAYWTRGLAYLQTDQYDQAINDCSQTIRMDPNIALAYFCRGHAKLKKGDSIGGNADLAKAKALGFKE